MYHTGQRRIVNWRQLLARASLGPNDLRTSGKNLPKMSNQER